MSPSDERRLPTNSFRWPASTVHSRRASHRRVPGANIRGCASKCQDALVETELVSRAMEEASALAGVLGLTVNDAVVIHNSNKLTLRLLPCDVLARVAPLGQEVAALEVEIAQRLAAVGGPVAALEPRVEARVYELARLEVTFWTYYEATPDHYSPADYARALQRLHVGMRGVEVTTPHFMERVAAAERLVTNRQETPALSEGDRHLILDTLHSASQQVHSRGAAEQLLHGEPHPGNLLSTQRGRLFVDFETCCRGPVEFDVAHVPDEVSACYPDVDRVLLQECRRLVLAMVAAWRWDVSDEFRMVSSTVETSWPYFARVHRGRHSVLWPPSDASHSHAAMRGASSPGAAPPF